MLTMKELQQKLKKFGGDRNWTQFHSPKNLSMALSVEASELVEIFQWMSEAESQNLSTDDFNHAQEELADIFMYTLLMAEYMNIDLLDAATQKFAKNENKYPIT